MMRRLNLSRAQPFQWLEGDDRIVFVAYSGNSGNIWDVAISKNDWQIKGDPRQLTTGGGEYDPAVARDGTMVFSTGTSSRNLWRLPMDVRRGQVTGSLERVTRGESLECCPYFSADGKKMVYASDQSGNWDIWMLDLASGTETPVVATPAEENRALISPDGTKLVFRRIEAGKPMLYTVSVEGGAETRICDDCRPLPNMTSDGKKVLTATGTTERLITVDVATGRKADLAVDPEHTLYDGILSPDGRWLALNRLTSPGRSTIVVAPIHEGRPAGPEDFIEVAAGPYMVARPWWSPDGSLLYFFSQSDGYLCLWARRLDPQTRQPLGEAFAVHHFHEELRLPFAMYTGYGMTADALYLPLVEGRSNIWLAKPQPGR